MSEEVDYKAAEHLATLIDLGNRSFRNVADCDYLSARVLYRVNLAQQFLWSAHQAIEKYLKGVLLFNEIPSNPLNHDLQAALEKLAEITDIPFEIPDDVREFVKYLNEQGGNRYFEYPTYTEGEELLKLDRSVWHIRRYCYYMRTRLGTVDWFPHELKRVHSFGIENAQKFRIHGGYLEKLLNDKHNPLREHLVWKNFYYGAKRKRTIRNFRLYAGSSNPTLFLHPEAFPKLDALVKFSKPIRDYFKKDPPAP